MNTAARHRDLARWWGVPIAGERDLPALKDAFTRRGLDRRAWRLYLDYGDALFAPLKPEWLGDDTPFSTPARAARYLALLQALESDLPPQAEFVRALLDWDLPADRLEALPPRFFKAAWKRYTLAELHGDAAEVLAEEITPLARWFINEARALHDNQNLLKAGWASLLRACAQAHEEEEKDVPLDTSWFAIVRAIETGPFRIVALLNQHELVEEGAIMAHCIASYGQWFATELARPFSIRCRKTGMRLASMVVYEDSSGVWKIDQIRGLRNVDVPATMQEAAWAVVLSIEEAVARDPALAARIDEARSRQPKDCSFSCELDF